MKQPREPYRKRGKITLADDYLNRSRVRLPFLGPPNASRRNQVVITKGQKRGIRG